MFCPKHPRYQAIFKPRVKRTACRCRLLYVLKRLFGVRVGRPVVRRISGPKVSPIGDLNKTYEPDTPNDGTLA